MHFNTVVIAHIVVDISQQTFNLRPCGTCWTMVCTRWRTVIILWLPQARASVRADSD